jgi:hypothetical protein
VLPASSSWASLEGAINATVWAADAAAQLPKPKVVSLARQILYTGLVRTLPSVLSPIFTPTNSTLPDGTLICRTGMLTCPDYTGPTYSFATKGGNFIFAGEPPDGPSIWQTGTLGVGILCLTPAVVACAIAGGTLTTAKAVTAIVDDIRAGEPERIPGDILFNVVPSLIPDPVKSVWRTICGFSSWCSGPHLTNPLEG